MSLARAHTGYYSRSNAQTLTPLTSRGWRSAGGLTYLTPAQNAGPTYYKIASGNPLTFGWNYTSL